jgi:hypothetical protein
MNRGPIDGPGVAVVLAHQRGGVVRAPLFGDGVLRIERQHVVVAPRLLVQEAPQPRKVLEGFLQRGSGLFTGLVQFLQPAGELEIAQASGSLLDVGLQVIERSGKFRMAFASQLRQVADQRLAAGLDKTRQAARQVGVQYSVARKKTLVEQADIQFDILVVHLGAFLRSTHRVADPQARIPQLLQKRGNRFLVSLRQRVRFEEQQQVYVGIWK